MWRERRRRAVCRGRKGWACEQEESSRVGLTLVVDVVVDGCGCGVGEGGIAQRLKLSLQRVVFPIRW
jgi:hypothetical protein